MTNVILVAHILVSIVLVIVVLMQRSEGGALGIGGGGGGAGGGLMSGAGVTGALVRTTIIFGAIFFISSLTLTTIATHENADGRTDVQRELESNLPTGSETDELGLNGLDDILSSDEDLLSDPLAASPSNSSPLDQPAETEEDPLASEADPQ
ncbi:MAG: preprotein translocase subunit SecG [Henriciella sp.]|jgi:preprotein translocase subunit SecG|mmetsp:Transcript_25278/g.32379  ORF Transcript_25278/g.32379 Transcript_25278/m.32379 type:complete len:152 (+) Transcript_25278:841-1296(+)